VLFSWKVYELYVCLSQIGRIERGEINATISTIYVIAKALDVHPMELYSFEVTGFDKDE